ncbi:MAG: NADH-quinone oxidoreductase subunit NuoE [Ignavibacteriales bacterium]
MLLVEQNHLSLEISDLIEKYGKQRSSLIPILQEIQTRHSYISEYAQQEIANQLDIHPVEVYSVISFYSFLSEKQKGKNIVRLCQTITCDLSGKKNIEKAIERELGIKFGETSNDGKITLEHANCLGMCDQGPAMLINSQVFTKLTPESAVNLIKEKMRR